jgi:hypothetical protein
MQQGKEVLGNNNEQSFFDIKNVLQAIAPFYVRYNVKRFFNSFWKARRRTARLTNRIDPFNNAIRSVYVISRNLPG